MVCNVDEFIYPLFVKKGKGRREEIPSMPGVFILSLDVLSDEIGELSVAGVNKVLLFGVPDEKTPYGEEAYCDENIVGQASRRIKGMSRDISVFTDVCLCAYTSHGHCGIIAEGEEGIDREMTLKYLSKIALAHAEAGADYVAPSAMARGQVEAIRKTLDAGGYGETRIMAYSAKFASNAYGPFRDIADSAPRFGDRKGYQLDYTRSGEALDRIGEDIDTGADIVMVKPALWYLDMVKEAKERYGHSLAVYNVSGEYAMVKEGAKAGLWEEDKMVDEIISSMKRAGADLIITYHAKDIARRTV